MYLAVPPVPPPSEDVANGTSTSSNLDFITNVTTTSTSTSGTPPDCFNENKMSKLSMYQIVWWNESYQTCKLATDGNAKKNHVRFKRDANGKLDPAGNLKDPHLELRVKYEKEVRLGLGCAATKCRSTDKIEGTRCACLLYTSPSPRD